jgi:hypothetical protein
VTITKCKNTHVAVPKHTSLTVRAAAKSVRNWFEDTAVKLDKSAFETERLYSDCGHGCVYVFSGTRNAVIYVGQTGCRLKVRTLFQTSPHRKQRWWRVVRRIAFINIANRADRLLLEALLIAALKPSNNRAPSLRDLKAMNIY